MEESIQYEIDQKGYGVIYLNRPNKRNAISSEMVDALKNSLMSLKQSEIKFLVITGTGERMFCAGGDLNNLHGDLTIDEAFTQLYPMKEVLYEIVSFPVPTICLLNGDALGGGCEIATACDFRIAKEGTKFGFVQTSLGITPGWGGGALLYEKTLASFAYQWLVEAETYDAVFLKDAGWIQRLVAKNDWSDREKLLAPYLSKSTEQMKILKSQYMKKLSTLRLSTLMDDEVRNCAKLWETKEHKDAVKKFLTRK